MTTYFDDIDTVNDYESGGYDLNKTSTDEQRQKLTQTQEEQHVQFEVVSDEALTAIERAEEKNKQVTKIAQDAVELKEAFNDLQDLVNEQGDNLNVIEKKVEDTKENAQQGVENIKTAEKNQIAARKKQLYILICILVLVGIIVISSLCGSGNC